MRRRFSLLAVLAANVFSIGCSSDQSSFFISYALDPDSSDCALMASGGMGLANGFYDVLSGAPYYVAVTVNSQILSHPTLSGVDPSGIQITEADVELRDSLGQTLATPGPNPFILDVSAYVPPSTGTGSLGSGGLVLNLIPSNYLSAVQSAVGSYVVARVTLKGHTNGQLNVESGLWTWVIDISAGGLAYTSAECADPTMLPTQGCFPGSNRGRYCP